MGLPILSSVIAVSVDFVAQTHSPTPTKVPFYRDFREHHNGWGANA